MPCLVESALVSSITFLAGFAIFAVSIFFGLLKFVLLASVASKEMATTQMHIELPRGGYLLASTVAVFGICVDVPLAIILYRCVSLLDAPRVLLI